MSSTELDASFTFLIKISICHHSNTLIIASPRVIVEDIVMLEPGPGLGRQCHSQLSPGLWPRSGQLPRPALQDGAGRPGLAGQLPGLRPLLLGVRLLSDQGVLGARHHLQGLQWGEQWAGSATQVMTEGPPVLS